MKVYLDNCCFNRPYDDQSQVRISLETQAKLYIQELIRSKKLSLVTSYVLLYENSHNPYEMRKKGILDFVREYTAEYVDVDAADAITALVPEIMKTGIKAKDAHHVACAIHASCDYFLTTDQRLLNYKTDKIQLVNPVDFLKLVD